MSSPPHDIISIDYSRLSLIDCLNTGVINQIFTRDIHAGKWDGARHLDVQDNLLCWSIHTLLSRPEVTAHLESLDLSAVILIDEALDALISTPALRGLHTLHLGRVRNRERQALYELMSSPHLTSVTRLELECPWADEHDLELLASTPRAWVQLGLYGTQREGIFAPFFSSSSFAHLRELDLSGCRLGLLDRELLVHAPWLPHLTSLCVDGTLVSPGDVAQICTPAGDIDMALESLSARSNQWCADDVVQAWNHMGDHMPRLELLRLGHNELGPKGLRAVLGHAVCAHVRELDLTHTRLDVCAMNQFGQNSHLDALHTLTLSANPLIGDEGARILAQTSHMHELRALAMRSCGVTTSGVRALLESPMLTLDASLCHFDPRGRS